MRIRHKTLQKTRVMLLVKCLFSFWSFGFSQNTSSISELAIPSEVKSFEVFRSGKMLMLTHDYDQFLADSLNGLWQSTSLPLDTAKIEGNLYRYDIYPQKLFHFNSDTLLTLAHTARKYGGMARICLSMDGGETWRIPIDQEVPYSVSIDIFNNKAWMANSSGKILFSDTYGMSWKYLFDNQSKDLYLYRVDMLDSLIGVGYGKNEAVFLTLDNWKNYQKIPSPKDQNLCCQNTDSSEWCFVRNLSWLGGHLFCEQGETFFYFDVEAGSWSSFNEEFSWLVTDPFGETAFGITRDLEVFQFSQEDFLWKSTHSTLDLPPSLMKIVNGRLYCLDLRYDIYEVSLANSEKVIPKSTKNIVSDPKYKYQGDDIDWGYDSRMLFRSNDSGKSWIREISTPQISDVKVLDDQTLILHLHGNHNLKYDSHEKSFEEYHWQNPLTNFLNTKVVKIDITEGGGPLLHGYETTITFRRNKEHFEFSGPDKTVKDTIVYSLIKTEVGQDPVNHRFDATTIDQILKGIDTNYLEPVIIDDFTISSSDINLFEQQTRAYISTIRGLKNRKNKRNHLKRFIDQKRYRNDDLLHSTIYSSKNSYSFQKDLFLACYLINESGDSLRLSASLSRTTSSTFYPINVDYNGIHFDTYSPELVHFIQSALPTEFFTVHKFLDNSALLRRLWIMDYCVERNNSYCLDTFRQGM